MASLDVQALATVDTKGANAAVPWVLMASFLYYHRDESVLSDHTFDHLTTIIRDRWDEITHQHRHLCKALRGQTTSSLFALRECDYPTITRSTALRLVGVGCEA